MRKVRVLLAGMPRMLADIVGAVVASQADFELTGEFELAGEVVGPAVLSVAIRDTSPDVLIFGRPLSRKEAKRLLYPSPRLKIVTIDRDGRDGEVHELQHVSSPLTASPAALVTAMRRDLGCRDQRGLA